MLHTEFILGLRGRRAGRVLERVYFLVVVTQPVYYLLLHADPLFGYDIGACCHPLRAYLKVFQQYLP